MHYRNAAPEIVPVPGGLLGGRAYRAPPAPPRPAPVAAEAAAAPAPARWLGFAGWLLICCVTRISCLYSEWSYDCGAWLYLSSLIDAGARPYADVWDNKLPTIYWLGSAFLATGAPRIAMYATDVLLTFAGGLGLATLLRRAGHPGARVWPVVALVPLVSAPFWVEHAVQSYGVPLLFVGHGLLAAGPAARRCYAWRCFGAGVCYALAITFRPPLAIEALLGFWFVPRAVARPERFALRAGMTALGGALVAAVLLRAAHDGGWLHAMWAEAVGGAFSYASGASTNTGEDVTAVLVLAQRQVRAGIVAWVLVGLAAVMATARGRPDGAQGRWVMFALLHGGSAFASTFLSGHQYAHYHYGLAWSAVLLFGIVLAAHGDLALGPDRRRLIGRAVAGLAIVVILSDPRIMTGIARAARGHDAQARIAAFQDWLLQRVAPDETVLFAGGFDTIGLMAGLPRRPGTRHALASMYRYDEFDHQAPAGGDARSFFHTLGRRFVGELERRGPTWIVQRDACHRGLAQVLADRYEPAARQQDWTLWRRRQDAPRGR